MQVSTCWTEAASLATTLDICSEIAMEHALQAGSLGSSIAAAISERRYGDLCNFDIIYGNDDSAVELAHARQAVAFYSKLADLDIGIDKEAAAVNTWLQTEEACAHTNDIFRARKSCRFSFRPSDAAILSAARKLIRRVLGPCPSLSALKLSFGPGATTSIKKKDACPTVKMAEKPTCSESLLAAGLIPEIVRECPHWFEQHTVSSHIDDEGWHCDVVEFKLDHGKLEFVPKSAKTFRTIDKQPTVNTLLQRGIGKFISKRLKRAGLDLKDQSINRAMAEDGSLTGSLATIDLSNASDTIAKELVRYLLPGDWFKLLNAARVHSTTYKKRVIPLEKFSSQGNGFTFPLESLIFWALARCSVPEGNLVNVYGDDIICESQDFQSVVNTLMVAGFTVNVKKSFHDGKFRESCGGDYYAGINIRPFYQKTLMSGESLYTLHNHYYRKGMLDFAERVRRYIPKGSRLYGPDGYGDGHLLSDTWKSIRRQKDINRGYGGDYFSTYRKCARSVISVYPGDYITPLYLIYIRDKEDPLSHLTNSERGIRHSSDGRPFWDLPGDTDGAYEKILIYKFS